VALCEKAVTEHTFIQPKDVQISEIARLAAGCQCVLAQAEEVLSNLGVAEGLHVLLRTVNTTTRLVESNDVYGIRRVTVEIFAAEI